MVAAQQGDAASYRHLLQALDAWLRKYLGAQHSAVDTDDLVQETLLAIHLKRATYDPAQPLLPWVRAIARYKKTDFYRRHKRRREAHTNDFTMIHATETISTQAENTEALDHLLDRLPRPQAEVIRLVRIEGLTIQEAATRLGRSPAWVKVNVHRALKAMKQHADGAAP
ncbi:MAG: sigma-70 family RNA polymerase sigma factor [Phycisphaeraceae bacterium]